MIADALHFGCTCIVGQNESMLGLPAAFAAVLLVDKSATKEFPPCNSYVLTEIYH